MTCLSFISLCVVAMMSSLSQLSQLVVSVDASALQRKHCDGHDVDCIKIKVFVNDQHPTSTPADQGKLFAIDLFSDTIDDLEQHEEIIKLHANNPHVARNWATMRGTQFLDNRKTLYQHGVRLGDTLDYGHKRPPGVILREEEIAQRANLLKKKTALAKMKEADDAKLTDEEISYEQWYQKDL